MIETRIAEPADRAAVRHLLDLEHLHYYGRPLGAEAQGTAVGDILDRKTCAMLLALEGHAPIGFATYAILHPSVNGHGTLFLKDLFVTETHRGQGIGRRLLAALARQAQAQGCARLDWTTETGNPGARKLYETLGAHLVAEKLYFRVPEHDFAGFIARCED